MDQLRFFSSMLWLALPLALAWVPARCAAQRADLMLTGLVEPSGSVRPGQSVVVSLRFFNAGPAHIPANNFMSASASHRIDDGAPFVVSAIPTTQPCGFGVGQLEPPEIQSPHVFGFSTLFTREALNAGESRQCSVQITFAAHAAGTYRLFYEAAALAPDPTRSNNFFTAVFDVVPLPTPVPALSPLALLAMGAVIATMGAYRRSIASGEKRGQSRFPPRAAREA